MAHRMSLSGTKRPAELDLCPRPLKRLRQVPFSAAFPL